MVLFPPVFTHGILVPILKKSTLDPSVAKNYEPVQIKFNIVGKVIDIGKGTSQGTW